MYVLVSLSIKAIGLITEQFIDDVVVVGHHRVASAVEMGASVDT